MMSTIPLSPVQRAHRRSLLNKIEIGQYSMEAVPACLCGTPEGILVADHDRYGIPVGFVLCQTCGLVRTTPRLATAHLGEFYENEYHGLHFGVASPRPSAVLYRTGQGNAIFSFLANRLPPGSLRVADVGAGTGQVLREFEAAAGSRATGSGCEYASAFVAAGLAAGTDLRQGGPETLAELAPFDVVILSHVVEHFPEPVQDLAAVRALGHPGTLFYVEVPGLLTIAQKPEYAYTLAHYLTLAHTFHFTLATLAATMQRAGFELVEGDETVHSVFRQGLVRSPATDPREAGRLLDSLERLRGWRIRVRRIVPLARQRAAASAKEVLPGWAVAMIRRARGR
jgi:SAM-dependent methyltransferase